MHDIRRCGSPDLSINPKHARKRLQLFTRHSSLEIEEISSRRNDPRVTANKTVCLPIVNGLKSEEDTHTYSEALGFDPNRPERIANSESILVPARATAPSFNIQTRPPSIGDDHFDIAQEQNIDDRIEEIIIDLDDELEEDGGICGRNSPDYSPNENIRVSDEDKRTFFNKKQKAQKVKTEARKIQDKEYITQVRRLKEKAASLRRYEKVVSQQHRLSSTKTMHSNEQRRELEKTIPVRENGSNVSNRSNPSLVYSRQSSSQSSTANNVNRSFKGANTNPISAQREQQMCLGFNNSNNSNSNTSPYETQTSLSSHNSLQNRNSSNSGGNFFDQLIRNACSTVQKQKEKDAEQKERDRLIMHESLSKPKDIDPRRKQVVQAEIQRVEGLVDKLLGSNTSNNLAAALRENHTRSHNQQINEEAEGDEDIISIHSNSSSPYQAATPPYQPATPPTLEELERRGSAVEEIVLSSDDEPELCMPTEPSAKNGDKSKTQSTKERSRSKDQNTDNDIIVLDDNDGSVPLSFQNLAQKDMENLSRRVKSKDIIGALNREINASDHSDTRLLNESSNVIRNNEGNKRKSFDDELLAADINVRQSSRYGKQTNMASKGKCSDNRRPLEEPQFGEVYPSTSDKSLQSSVTTNISRSTKPKRRRTSIIDHQ